MLYGTTIHTFEVILPDATTLYVAARNWTDASRIATKGTEYGYMEVTTKAITNKVATSVGIPYEHEMEGIIKKCSEE